MDLAASSACFKQPVGTVAIYSDDSGFGHASRLFWVAGGRVWEESKFRKEFLTKVAVEDEEEGTNSMIEMGYRSDCLSTF